MDEIFEFAFVPVRGKSSSDTLPGHPAELIRQGKFHDADIIFGWNSNEGTVLTYVNFTASKYSVNTVRKLVRRLFTRRIP